MHLSLHHAALAAVPSATQDPRELRAAPRVPCSVPVMVERNGARLGTRFNDMSATGAAVYLDAAVDLGEVLGLEFTLPGTEDAVRCSGLVRSMRWSDGRPVAGVEFHHLPPARRKDVARWVRQELNPEPGDIARNHWSGDVHSGEAFVVPDAERSRRILRWSPGLASLFTQVARHLGAQDRVFVPYIGRELEEGDRLFLEVVPPSSHCIFRALAEVVWVQREESGTWGKGVGLRLAGMTPMDRHLLGSMLAWFRHEEERYR